MRLLPSLLILLLLLFAGALTWVALHHERAAAAGALAAGAGAQDPKRPQGHVYTGVAEEPKDVNPYTTHGSVARALVLAHTHDSLLSRDPRTGALRAGLASSYEVADDCSSCTFTLREGVVFSDGSPMTMADVRFGYDLHRAGHLATGAVAGAYDKVSAFEPLDDRRFRLVFHERHFAQLETVGLGWVVGCKRFFVEQVRARLGADEAMPAEDSPRFAELFDQIGEQCGPGTGPYLLRNGPDGASGWRARRDLTLTRNDGSWRRAAHPGTWNFDGIRTLFRAPAAARNALLTGELDWYSGAQLDELLEASDVARERYRKLVFGHPRLGPFRIVWNCRRAPCDDPRVRRALGMLVDRAAMVEVFSGAAKPSFAHALPGTPEYPDVGDVRQDLPGARRLLREAGYDEERPLRLSMLALSGTNELRRLAALFADAARKVGIELEVRELVYTALLAEKGKGDWDGMLVMQYLEVPNDPHRYLHTDGLDNEGGWSHAEADRLAVAARTEPDPVRRAELWRRLHELAHEEQPVTLLVHPLVSLLLNRHLRGLEPGPLGLRPDHAWMPKEHQRR